MNIKLTTNAATNTAISLVAGDTITQLEFVLMKSGETPIQAMSALRYIATTSPTDIAAFQATSGFSATISNIVLANSVTYQCAARVTVNRSIIGAVVGPWVSLGSITPAGLAGTGYNVLFVVMAASAPVSILGTLYTPDGTNNILVPYTGALPRTFIFTLTGGQGGLGDVNDDWGGLGGAAGGSSAVGLAPLDPGGSSSLLAMASGLDGQAAGDDYPGGSAYGPNGGFGTVFGSIGISGISGGFNGFTVTSSGSAYVAGNYNVSTQTIIFLGAGFGGHSSVDGGNGTNGSITVT